MRSIEIEVIFVKHLFKLDLYFSHIKRSSGHFGSIYKIEPRLKTALWTPTSYAKMFGNNDRLIQFWISLYPMLLFPRSPQVVFQVSCFL